MKSQRAISVEILAQTGQLIRQVFIVTNDPQQPEIVVEFEANILSPSEP